MESQDTSAFLRELRTSAGLTQDQVARHIGASRVKYVGLEAGRTELSLSEIKALAALYQVSIEEIVDGKLMQPDGAVPSMVFRGITLSEAADELSRETDSEVNYEKLRNLLLYVVSKVGAKPNVGETVIYKLLYFIDFDYYEKNGCWITGLSYIKNHYGPTPDSDFFAVTADMRDTGELEIITTDYFDFIQKKYLPVVQPKLSCFTADEIKHIDWVLDRLSDKSASELSALSHKDMPWIATRSGQRIDYQLAMYRTADTSVRVFDDEL